MVTASLLSLVLLAGTAQPVDPGGWRELRWGMTLAEVKAAFQRMNASWTGSEDRDGELLYSYVVKMNEWLGNSALVEEAECGFVDGGRGGLWVIELYFRQGSSGYEELLSALTKKYGKPAFRMVSGTANVVTTRWRLPTTVVALQGSKTYGLVSLSYYDSRKMQADSRPYKLAPVDDSKL